ncbi:TIGR01244 family sulfur transferase [Hyphococcus formosus]|uniref:TIGR01244 family sulfur transferase n=1 Tax=Hyphococcus formosus TaxID=3143534 RepID=UPI00398A6FA5
MPEKFKRLTDTFFVSPQISLDEVSSAAEAGFALIVNNRPDGEMAGQPPSADIQAEAEKAGIKYVYIPIDGRGLSLSHISALKSAIDETDGGKAIGYCASGTRSAILYFYFAAFEGRPSEDIIADAANAGFNISQHGPALDNLAARAKTDDE